MGIPKRIHFNLIDNIEADPEMRENFDMVGSFDVHNMSFIPRVGEEITFGENRVEKEWGNCLNKNYFSPSNTYEVTNVFYELADLNNFITIDVKLKHNNNKTCSLHSIP